MERLVLVVAEDSPLFLELLQDIWGWLKGRGGVRVLGCINIPNPALFFSKGTDMAPDILVIDTKGSMSSDIIEVISKAYPEASILAISHSTDIYTLLEDIDDVLNKF